MSRGFILGNLIIELEGCSSPADDKESDKLGELLNREPEVGASAVDCGDLGPFPGFNQSNILPVPSPPLFSPNPRANSKFGMAKRVGCGTGTRITWKLKLNLLNLG